MSRKPKPKPISNNNLNIDTNISIAMLYPDDTNNLDIIQLVKLENPDLTNINISNNEYNVLYYLYDNYTIIQIQRDLKISFAMIEMMKIKSKLFEQCLNKIKQLRINMIENEMITQYNESSDDVKKFIVKGNIPSYRDSFVPEIQGLRNITISIEGIGKLNIDAGRIASDPIKDVTEDTDNDS